MRFWDSSAILPLLVEEPTTSGLTDELRIDDELIVWWASRVECVSAIARLEREGALTADETAIAIDRLTALATAWQEVVPGHRLRDIAVRLLRVHPLRAADALQLAAAITAAELEPSTLEFLTLDQRLATAATREGFRVRQSDSAVSSVEPG